MQDPADNSGSVPAVNSTDFGTSHSDCSRSRVASERQLLDKATPASHYTSIQSRTEDIAIKSIIIGFHFSCSWPKSRRESHQLFGFHTSRLVFRVVFNQKAGVQFVFRDTEPIGKPVSYGDCCYSHFTSGKYCVTDLKFKLLFIASSFFLSQFQRPLQSTRNVTKKPRKLKPKIRSQTAKLKLFGHCPFPVPKLLLLLLQMCR